MKIKTITLAILILLNVTPKIYSNVDTVIFNLGLNAYNKGDYQEAIKNFERIFYDYPESKLIPKATMYLGYIYYDMEENEKAKKFLIASVKSSTKGSEVWINSMKLLGIIYYDEGNTEKYEKIFSELKKYSSPQEKVIKQKTTKETKLPNNKQITKKEITNQTITNEKVITNYVTNYITNIISITNLPKEEKEEITNIQIDENLSNLIKVKEKVEEIKNKEEELEELNRLSDIKNRLLKLNEKALMIKEILKKKEEEKR